MTEETAESPNSTPEETQQQTEQPPVNVENVPTQETPKQENSNSETPKKEETDTSQQPKTPLSPTKSKEQEKSTPAKTKNDSLYWLNRSRIEDASDPVDMRPDSEEWTSQELHLFIVTDAGKPVYSRYGTVQKLSPILCTCVAILGHMESLNEELNHFRAGSHTFVFLPKSPFVFIAVSKSSLPVSYLFKQLNFLYNLFLSLFSENLINQLSARPACDFRQIAEGTRPAWDGVVNNMSEDPAFIFAPSVPVSHMRPDQRAAIVSHFDKLQSCKLSMLMFRNRVLAVGKCTCDSLSLRLIVDLMWTPAFQSGESWTPFFARDSTDGMHHLYINKHKSSDFALVMLCSDSPNLGVAYHTAATHIFQELEEKYIVQLEKPLDWEPKVFYCWALHSIAYGQVYITDPVSPHFAGQTKQDSIKKMQELSKQLAKSCDMVETNAVDGEYMFRGEKEVIVVYKCSTHEIYAIAKSEDLKDSELSAKLAELKNFINAHFNELIIVESKFHINKFT